MLDLAAPLPLSLYVHIPWCVRKCPYCDFNSHVHTGNQLPEKKYIEALLNDLDAELPTVSGREVKSIFIGGGTPSLFSVEAINHLIDELYTRLNIAPTAEITIEANPGAVEREKLSEFADCGINRLSLGIQTFNDEMLHKLGRIHSANEARLAIDTAKNARFNSINLDLMFALPGQTEQQAIFDIKTAISYQPQHISYYQLTIEPNTAFFKQPPTLPDDDHSWQIQIRCQQQLVSTQYQQYEVSAWSLNEHQCQHNLNYWRFGDYLGIGAGAHQKLSMPNKQQIIRRSKKRSPTNYMESVGKQPHIDHEINLTEKEITFEFMLNALRLTDGFPTELFTRHTGLSIDIINNQLEQAEEQNLIERNANSIKPSSTGRLYLNELLMLFMPDS